MICGLEAIYVPSEARLILEQDLKKEIVTCKHYGSHTCTSKNIQQIDCSEIKEVAKGSPKLTRKGFIRQKIQNCLEEKSYRSAVETASTLTNTTSIDNIKKRVKKKWEDQMATVLRRKEYCKRALIRKACIKYTNTMTGKMSVFHW